MRGLWASLLEPEAVDVLADDELEAHVVLQASLGHLADEALHALGVGDGGVFEEGVDVGGDVASVLAVDGGVEVGQGRGGVAEGGELADELGLFAGLVVAAGGEELLLYLLEFEGAAARSIYAGGCTSGRGTDKPGKAYVFCRFACRTKGNMFNAQAHTQVMRIATVEHTFVVDKIRFGLRIHQGDFICSVFNRTSVGRSSFSITSRGIYGQYRRYNTLKYL